jgi:mercuric ion binding protein
VVGIRVFVNHHAFDLFSGGAFMIGQIKVAALAVTAIGGLAAFGKLCTPCGAPGPGIGVPPAAFQAPVADTATVRLHISGMTCGTCPVTARAALQKLPGVFSAKVTLDDSLGVVRYDPRRVSPEQIAAHLTRLTGYGARILSDQAKGSRRSGS